MENTHTTSTTLVPLRLSSVKVDNFDVSYQDGKYYFDLTEAVTVNVTYKEEVINPNTITFLKLGFIAIIIFAIYNLFISKKLKLKRYA